MNIPYIAVTQDEYALQYADENLKANREFILATVALNGEAL